MAASGMQDIKRRIRSVSSIEHITKAMKLVSAAKFRRAKATFEDTREYFHYVTESLMDIFNNTNDVPTKYLDDGKEKKRTLFVIITSNRGLAGSFNTGVIREAEKIMAPMKDDCYVLAIGVRGRDYFARRGYNIAGEYILPPENISFVETHDISRPVIKLFDEGKIDSVTMITTMFVSPLEQRVTNTPLLPLNMQNDPEVLPHEQQVDYEPSSAEVFNYLVPKYVEIMIYNAIVESATCEHAARRIAMENATDNAQQMIANLNLYYNRARQAAITNEITEIVSGAEALV